MTYITDNSIKVKLGKISDTDCASNFDFWMNQVKQNDSELLTETLKEVDHIFPAHTFAYEYDGFSPLKAIFGYDEGTGSFNRNCKGVIAKRFRTSVPDFGHMSTSLKLEHDIFNFAYLGAHNPYHRLKDDPPIRPFGLFIEKEGVENFPECHGSPCDVAEENDLVDRKNLKRYYLLPNQLRELKSHEIVNESIKSGGHSKFWFYFGNPNSCNEEDYMKSLYKRTGELRYFHYIRPSAIKAILWPFFIDTVDANDNPNMNENLDLYNAFVRTFKDIDVIKYGHDNDYQQNWETTLLEASFKSMKYYVKENQFPDRI